MSEPLRWGILGTGKIARKFAGQLPQSSRARLAAVGSRQGDAAAQFAGRFGGRPHGSYAHLLADETVEAVYVSVPNGLHHEWTVRALEAGKHVLCEKPIASNAAQAETMFDAAERAGRVLVEAFMYRCHPAIDALIETVRRGEIGQVRLIRSHFTFHRPVDADDARYRADLAGGAMMDVGCYCLHFARAIVGREPTAMHAVAHRHAGGVDQYAAGCLDFGGRTLGVFTCGMTVEADRTTFIGGSKGYIAIDGPWFGHGTFTLAGREGEDRRTVRVDAPLEPYALEAERFAEIIQDGAAAWITPDDTLGNMRALDELRRQVGVPV